MFDCNKCEALESEVKFLREANNRMTDRLTAIADARAFEAVSFKSHGNGDFVGDGNDEILTYNKYGEPVITKQVPKDPEIKETE